MLTTQAAQPLRSVIKKLEDRLGASDDNLGMQFKINTQPNWKGTIGLRCNHVFCESVPGYIDIVIRDLALLQVFPLLEHISVSRAFNVDPLTHRKRSVPWKRTLFITLRPGKELFSYLQDKLFEEEEKYLPIPILLGILENVK